MISYLLAGMPSNEIGDEKFTPEIRLCIAPPKG